jgi:hypothetical protein
MPARTSARHRPDPATLNTDERFRSRLDVLRRLPESAEAKPVDDRTEHAGRCGRQCQALGDDDLVGATLDATHDVAHDRLDRREFE